MSSPSPVVARAPSGYSKQRIARIAEGALRDAGVVGALPTPIEAVQQAVGVRERVSIADLPKAVAVKKPSRIARVLGAYLHEDRVVFIDTSQPEPRRLFTDAHETIHAACPWHEEAVRWDGEDELFKRRYEEVEGEANYGAGHLIFQGGRFHREALQDRVSLAVPLALHAKYGASRVATAHYYVEEHPEPVALLVLGRYIDLPSRTYPIWRSVQSQSFLERYGALGDRYPDGVPAAEGSFTGGLLEAAQTATHPSEAAATMMDLKGSEKKCTAEAFFNGHVQLLMISPRHRIARGRRIQLATA